MSHDRAAGVAAVQLLPSTSANHLTLVLLSLQLYPPSLPLSLAAFMHFYTESQRTQLKSTSIRVVEIIPPSVHTALHRDREDPDDNNPSKSNAITQEDFMNQVAEGWEKDQDVITAGMGKELVKKWYDAYGEQLGGAQKAWQGKEVK